MDNIPTIGNKNVQRILDTQYSAEEQMKIICDDEKLKSLGLRVCRSTGGNRNKKPSVIGCNKILLEEDFSICNNRYKSSCRSCETSAAREKRKGNNKTNNKENNESDLIKELKLKKNLYDIKLTNLMEKKIFMNKNIDDSINILTEKINFINEQLNNI